MLWIPIRRGACARLAGMGASRQAMPEQGKPSFPKADVDAFHAAGLGAGGTDEGAPGPRNHLPDAYAAYLRDPAGNKLCAHTFT